MFIYILRVILLFWIISIIIRWTERFFGAGKSSQQPKQQDSSNRRSVNEPPDIGLSGSIEDADFVELDGDE